jgi:hypothetical protein
MAIKIIHIKVDKESKLINKWMVKPACDHDSHSLDPLLEKADEGSHSTVTTLISGRRPSSTSAR